MVLNIIEYENMRETKVCFFVAFMDALEIGLCPVHLQGFYSSYSK